MLSTGHDPPHGPGLQEERAPLVGRGDELELLTGLLTEAEGGQAVGVLVSGDAGVGKTRLITELGMMAAARGFTVLSGRCAELADTVPYLPLADALRDAATRPSARGQVLDALATRPVLSQLLPDRQASQSDGADAPGLAQQQLFGAVLGMLAELAEAAPVLLVLEDLHWADRSTRDLVTFLSRVLHRERIALVATYRTDDMHRRHPLRPVVAELLRLPGVTALDLRPLPAAAMAEHLTQLSGGMLSAPVLDSLIDRAEGNAYYAEELLTASARPDVPGSPSPALTRWGGLAAAGRAAEPANLPAGLADLLLARMEQLSPAAQQVLRAAAVAGRHVDDELVMRASGLDTREYEEAVREAVAHQLLVPDGARGLAFRHALLREAVYADLLPGERTRLHASLAELLSDECRLKEVTGSAAELAHHALASHDIPVAFAASVHAGQEADRLTAPAEAHRHYDLALSLWDRVSDPVGLGGVERGDLSLRSALSAADAGDISRAVQQLRRLLSYLRPGADLVLLSRANQRLAYFLLELDEDTEALAAAKDAVNALPAEQGGADRAGALAVLALAQMANGAGRLARASAEQARAAGRAADAPWVVADALVTLGLLAERGGRVKTAVASFSRALAQARRAGVLGVELRAAFQLARIHLERGNLDAASATAHDGMTVAVRAGLDMAPYGFDLQYLHYLAHFSDGDWDHAQEIVDGFAVRVASEAEARLSAMALFVAVGRGSDAVEARRAWLAPWIACDNFVAYIARGLLAEHAYWQGDLEAALAETEHTITAAIAWAGKQAPQLIRVAAVRLAVLGDLAVQARASGDTAREQEFVAEARRVVEMARAGANNRGRPRISLGVDGLGWLARAEAECRRAEGENDPAAWQAVLDAFGPGFVYDAARARWRLAEALAEAGKREEAQAEWALAVAAADKLGAAPLRRALADLGRRLRLSPAIAGQPGPSAGRGPLAGLTGRELEVLRLLTAGYSNREIGAALFIAPKTASVHVSNILGKLRASSRTEAAAIAHSNGLEAAAPPRSAGQSRASS
ncbi:MAG TPA: AAA family ATPase [Streptosporangiaceae bacterium]|nr:AAA family ATPase [Streptosporangiaceae bacterium]